MTVFDALIPYLAIPISVVSLAVLVLVLYLTIKYTPKIVRIFELQPLFVPLRVSPFEMGEPVDFRSEDGIRLSGRYFRARSSKRAGVLVYCHEYLSDFWSFQPYLDHTRDLGYDVFAFDFRNHGTSARDPSYNPLQWTSDREVADLRAALRYLRSRPDHDPAGFGLFGVSRGGTTALIAAADEPDVWGIVTDGAFPTRLMTVKYMIRWSEIFVRSQLLLSVVPIWFYYVLAWVGRVRSERRHNCCFLEVETAVKRLGARPWLMIHGERDAYIGPEIARALFECGRGPKEFWLVPEAKHNRCREREPHTYAARIVGFLDRFGPRRRITVTTPPKVGRDEVSSEFADALAPTQLVRQVASPVIS
ncbi:MAG TPA: alpha/beta fold hydrolase [Isosphaeraceae bacterium]|nr:alpha/beta fold hydrolase [Isosphaeraceae bacterium]